jgi:hypothetical protein
MGPFIICRECMLHKLCGTSVVARDAETHLDQIQMNLSYPIIGKFLWKISEPSFYYY